MFDKYFSAGEVKRHFKKEFISLWNAWLGKENLHKLDEVSQEDWKRFNDLVLEISHDFEVYVVDLPDQIVSRPQNLETSLQSYEQSMASSYESFARFILPELECVLTEDWDYTYILWYKESGALQTLIPYIQKSGLKHFSG